MRTLVTFQSSAFNTTDRRPYFINEGCYGDDLARWLISQLQAKGITTESEPGQEDFGWYLTFRVAQAEHQFVISHRPETGLEPGTWIGWVERNAGLLSSILGGRGRGVETGALQAIHNVLASAKQVSGLRWHEKSEFEKGNEAAGSPQPDAA